MAAFIFMHITMCACICIFSLLTGVRTVAREQDFGAQLRQRIGDSMGLRYTKLPVFATCLRVKEDEFSEPVQSWHS